MRITNIQPHVLPLGSKRLWKQISVRYTLHDNSIEGNGETRVTRIRNFYECLRWNLGNRQI